MLRPIEPIIPAENDLGDIWEAGHRHFVSAPARLRYVQFVVPRFLSAFSEGDHDMAGRCQLWRIQGDGILKFRASASGTLTGGRAVGLVIGRDDVQRMPNVFAHGPNLVQLLRPATLTTCLSLLVQRIQHRPPPPSTLSLIPRPRQSQLPSSQPLKASTIPRVELLRAARPRKPTK
jgi:hypothetical protein